MRIERAPATCLAIAALLALAACAASPPPGPQPQRTYDHIAEPTVLYAATVDLFKRAGYGVAKLSATRRELDTSWKEGDGELRGAVRWRERRMYLARYELDPFHDQQLFFLRLVVQERPPGGGDWVTKAVDPRTDPEYGQLLQELDRTVKSLGGVRY
jgi:hypothetical protein